MRLDSTFQVLGEEEKVEEEAERPETLGVEDVHPGKKDPPRDEAKAHAKQERLLGTRFCSQIVKAKSLSHLALYVQTPGV